MPSNQGASTSGLPWLDPSLTVEDSILGPLEPVDASPKLPDLMQDDPENMFSGLLLQAALPADLPTRL